MSPAEKLLDRCVFAVTALAITVLPERSKEHPRLQPYATTSAHLVSAFAEIAAAVILFVWGMIGAVSGFSHGPAWEYLVRQPQLTQRDFFAMGALGYLVYLTRPTTWLLLYCFAEGVVRALEAAFWGRHLGLGVVWLGWQLGRQTGRGLRRRRLDTLLGPGRPDEIVILPPGRTVALEIFTVEDKPWSDTQVVELDGGFYELATRQLVRRGRWHAWRYQFLPLGDNEVIRGSFVRLPPTTGRRADEEARAGERAGPRSRSFSG